MDFGKYKYEQDQKRKESRKKASNVIIKEMKFRPKIDGHDYTTKMKHVERFLEEGSKVKLTIMFRGREMAHPELGRRILERVAEQVKRVRDHRVAPTPGRPQHDDGPQPDPQAAPRAAKPRRHPRRAVPPTRSGSATPTRTEAPPTSAAPRTSRPQPNAH